MAAQLDAAGAAKMGTIDEALIHLQRLHGLVERMAVAVKNREGTQVYGVQIRRAGTPMVGQLKGQFGMIADQVSALLLVASRGGSDQVRLRSLREGIAQIRTALEIAGTRVKEKHMVDDGDEKAPAGGSAPGSAASGNS